MLTVDVDLDMARVARRVADQPGTGRDPTVKPGAGACRRLVAGWPAGIPDAAGARGRIVSGRDLQAFIAMAVEVGVAGEGLLRALDHMRLAPVVGSRVITSYSIHYTKLYDAGYPAGPP